MLVVLTCSIIWLSNKLSFYPCRKTKYIFFSKFLVNYCQIPIYKNRMEQKFLTEALGPDKRSQMFKYLIGQKPNFECHGERPVPSIQFFHRAWMLELELIVYPVCLPGQTSSWRLIAVSLLGSPFLSLYVLIRLYNKGRHRGRRRRWQRQGNARPGQNGITVSRVLLCWMWIRSFCCEGRGVAGGGWDEAESPVLHLSGKADSWLSPD